MGLKLNEDYGDTVPSKPQVQVTNEVLATSTLKKQHTLEDMEEGIAYSVSYISSKIQLFEGNCIQTLNHITI